MSKLNQREQSLIDALKTRLADADALTVDGMLKEVEAAPEYNSHTHADHLAYLHMIPMLIGKQMELAGQDPYASGTDIDSAMTDNQRFTYSLHAQVEEPDFTQEDDDYKKKRQNLTDYIMDINAGKITDPDLSKEDLLKGAQDHMLEIDRDQDTLVKTREAALTRMDELEIKWNDEKETQSIEMKKDFMATRLKNVPKGELKVNKKLAENAWNTLKDSYGV